MTDDHTAPTTLRFTSKVDWWLAVVLVSLPVIAIGSAVAGMLTEDTAGTAVGWIAAVAVLAMYPALLWPIEYLVTDEQLVIRFGLVRTRVALERLRKVAPSRNPLSSPALSMDRLRIDYRGGFALISPADKIGFVRTLQERAPHLEVDPRLRGG